MASNQIPVEREVIVEVHEKYIVNVRASSAEEAIKKAREQVLCGIEPYYTNEIILDVLPIKETTI